MRTLPNKPTQFNPIHKSHNAGPSIRPSITLLIPPKKDRGREEKGRTEQASKRRSPQDSPIPTSNKIPILLIHTIPLPRPLPIASPLLPPTPPLHILPSTTLPTDTKQAISRSESLRRLLHSGLSLAISLDARETTLEHLQRNKRTGRRPEQPRESGECCVGAGGCAHGAAAEEELAEEDGEGDEAREVEEHA